MKKTSYGMPSIPFSFQQYMVYDTSLENIISFCNMNSMFVDVYYTADW